MMLRLVSDIFLAFIKNIISMQGRYHLPSATSLHSQIVTFYILLIKQYINK